MTPYEKRLEQDLTEARATIQVERLREELAGARALLLEAGPLIGAAPGWPGWGVAWLETPQP